MRSNTLAVAAKLASLTVAVALLSGCETTNSIPYKASTENVLTIQSKLKEQGKQLRLGDVSLAAGVDESPVCRLNGPIRVNPGKTPTQYIQSAFQEELFMAGVYSLDSNNILSGQVTELSFSSVSPASWTISMQVSSNNSSGYSVTVNYPFDTSWSAYSACKNVADAYGPAVQMLIKEVVNNPGFDTLIQ